MGLAGGFPLPIEGQGAGTRRAEGPVRGHAINCRTVNAIKEGYGRESKQGFSGSARNACIGPIQGIVLAIKPIH